MLFGSVVSPTTWRPVTSAAMPPDALHSAITSDTMSVTDTPVRSARAIEVSWNLMKLATSVGNARAMSLTWCSTCDGCAISP
jgi:hypothetical protein